MFMVSVKMTAKRLVCGALVLVLAVGAAGWGLNKLVSREKMASDTQPGISKGTAASPANGKNNEQRLMFIKAYGWDVNEEPVEIMEVIIPQEFDEIYEKYNEIQKQQGLDLSKYKGKRVKRYSYEIINYPDTRQTVRLNMLLYDGKIVGGDVSSTEIDGFMHGFER